MCVSNRFIIFFCRALYVTKRHTFLSWFFITSRSRTSCYTKTRIFDVLWRKEPWFLVNFSIWSYTRNKVVQQNEGLLEPTIWTWKYVNVSDFRNGLATPIRWSWRNRYGEDLHEPEASGKSHCPADPDLSSCELFNTFTFVENPCLLLQ